jgi:protocatechuate 3,4-dioxygenase beta subunit
MRNVVPARAVVLAVALCALAACSGGDSETSPADAPSTSTAADCQPTTGGTAQGTPTAGTDARSFVKLGPGSEITKEEAAAEAPARRGRPLFISGTVYGPDCRTPLSGALIEVWQTDARGVYGPGQRSGELRCCYLQGTVKTDSDGEYRIQTIRPAHYRGEDPPPPAHIHFNIHHGETGVLTEVVFADDPYLPADASGGEVISLQKDGNRLLGRFDIVLARAP